MVSLEKTHRIENPRSKHINVFKLLIPLLTNCFVCFYESLKEKNFHGATRSGYMINCVVGGEERFIVFPIGKM